MPPRPSIIYGRAPVGVPARWAAIERMMQAVAHPIRILILAALNERPMSPKQFSDAHPEHSLSTVAKHFRRLEQLGYIEEIGKSKGQRIFAVRLQGSLDPSGTERLASASNSLPGGISLTYAERIREALDASTFSSRDDARFLWTPLCLDGRSWRAALRAADALFYYAFKLYLEARDRLAEYESEPIRVAVGLGCYPSPRDSDTAPIIPPMKLWMEEGASMTGELRVDERLTKAFAHPLRVKILAALNQRPMSPKAFHLLYPEYALPTIAQHFRRLEELGCIEVVRRRRLPAEQNVFCLRPDYARFDQSTYSALPPAIRADADTLILGTYLDRLADAVIEDTIGRNSHLTWAVFHFDERACAEFVKALDGVYHAALLLQHATAQRQNPDSPSTFPVTLNCACFPVPTDKGLVTKKTVEAVMGPKRQTERVQLDAYLRRILRELQGGSADPHS